MIGDDVEFRIGSSKFVRVRPTRRPFPESDNLWDRDSLDADIEISTGKFHGQYGGSFRVDDFFRFRDQLEGLYKTLEGKARFDSYEDSLTINVSTDGLGHFFADCIARDEPGIGSTLYFSPDSFDQTELPPILKALNEILERFPVSRAS